MTECSRCGDCCENIFLGVNAQGFSIEQRIDAVLEASEEELPADSPRRIDAQFIRAHWTQTGERLDSEGKLRGGIYACDMFDSEARLCTAYEDRPPICVGFPWYGEDPDLERVKKLPSRCSFRVDVVLG